MVITIDREVYSSDALLITSIELSAKLTVIILDSAQGFRVEIKCCDGVSWNEELEKLFFENLTQAELRVRLRTMFAPVEKIIVEKAFSPLSK